MKKLGVVVPVYNKKEYLSQCIESIINQTYSELEIVLVDDGSTDGSGEICDVFAQKDKRIKVIHQKNQGMSYARYIGVQALQCEYVTFVDADDWLELKIYEKVSKRMEESYDMIIFSIQVYFNEQYQYLLEDYICEGSYSGENIQNIIQWKEDKNQYSLRASLCNKIIKKELLLKYLNKVLDLNIEHCEDMIVCYPLLFHCQKVYVEKRIGYFYRQRELGEIAEYLVDKNYIHYIYRFYQYMKHELKNQPHFTKDFDKFYYNAIYNYMKNTKQLEQKKEYLFPFGKVPVCSNIILYGAGNIGQIYRKQIEQLNYCNLVAWIDNKAEQYKQEDIQHISLLESNIEYDYIVIAIKNKEIVEKVINQLHCIYAIPKEKIIWSI